MGLLYRRNKRFYDFKVKLDEENDSITMVLTNNYDLFLKKVEKDLDVKDLVAEIEWIDTVYLGDNYYRIFCNIQLKC